MQDKLGEYKDKADDLKTTITDHVNKLKENMKEVRETVLERVQNLRQKANEHVDKLVEKAKEMKETVQSEIQKRAERMKGKFEEMMQQYEKAMARAIAMQKEAEANLRQVMEQMSNGSQELYERAKLLAGENVEVARGYVDKVQDIFMKQIEKFTLEVSIFG
jgi:ElaB/YqjD/DUF883 family membrane-anchored ribosome-binding protein